MNSRTVQYLQFLQLQKLVEESAGLELALVNQIQQRHMETFSFNSLAVLAGETINIDSDSIFEKICTRGLGGYCFEHNKLIFDVLTDLGFDVSLQLARVVKADDLDVPRTHRFSLLKLHHKKYIVDGGYGPMAPVYPVEFALNKVQQQGRDKYRVIQSSNEDYVLQRWNKEAFAPLYSFDLARYTESDCLTGHFYSHKHPSAAFVNNLVVSRKNSECIWSLRNHQLYRITADNTDITLLESPQHLQDALQECYGMYYEQAICAFLFERFIQPRLVSSVVGQKNDAP